jgi:GTP cyclohydrolase I
MNQHPQAEAANDAAATTEDNVIHGLAADYRSILSGLGEDLDREGLVRTPERAAKAIHFLTSGYRGSVADAIGDGVFESDSDEMIMVRSIELYSLCEHHLLPFIGQCHVGYIPNGRILGLSKIPRLVDLFSRRLQIQERLTGEIARSVMDAVDARGVGVVIEASHLCVMMRGVEKQHSQMKTSSMLGTFRSSQSTRTEFLRLLD